MTDNKDQTLPDSGHGLANGIGTPTPLAPALQPQSTIARATATVRILLGRMSEVKPPVPSIDPSRWTLVCVWFCALREES
jgi:hypothetical protein